jgi:hypothetical protein
MAEGRCAGSRARRGSGAAPARLESLRPGIDSAPHDGSRLFPDEPYRHGVLTVSWALLGALR